MRIVPSYRFNWWKISRFRSTGCTTVSYHSVISNSDAVSLPNVTLARPIADILKQNSRFANCARARAFEFVCQYFKNFLDSVPELKIINFIRLFEVTNTFSFKTHRSLFIWTKTVRKQSGFASTQSVATTNTFYRCWQKLKFNGFFLLNFIRKLFWIFYLSESIYLFVMMEFYLTDCYQGESARSLYYVPGATLPKRHLTPWGTSPKFRIPVTFLKYVEKVG